MEPTFEPTSSVVQRESLCPLNPVEVTGKRDIRGSASLCNDNDPGTSCKVEWLKFDFGKTVYPLVVEIVGSPIRSKVRVAIGNDPADPYSNQGKIALMDGYYGNVALENFAKGRYMFVSSPGSMFSAGEINVKGHCTGVGVTIPTREPTTEPTLRPTEDITMVKPICVSDEGWSFWGFKLPSKWVPSHPQTHKCCTDDHGVCLSQHKKMFHEGDCLHFIKDINECKQVGDIWETDRQNSFLFGGRRND